MLSCKYFISYRITTIKQTKNTLNHASCRGILHLYEDDGNTTEYMEGVFSNTTAFYVHSPEQ